MDINQAVTVVEGFIAQYRASHPGWAPVETRVHPSGDEQGTIKLWFNFGPDAKEEKLPALERELTEALAAAHPELAEIKLFVRSQAF